MNKNFFQALATLVGTVIGVGLFSLPYITARVGIWTMLFYFLILGTVVILSTLLYGEIVLRTKGLHRLPGYAEKYLGPKGKAIGFLASVFGLVGSILAYLVIGGHFLTSLFEPIFGGSYFIYVMIYFSLGAILIYFGIKSIAKTEIILLVLLFIVLGFIFFKEFSLISLDNLFAFESKYLFLPYGAVLFSLSAVGAVPEVKEILKKNPADLKKVIIWGTLISALTYIFFIFLITGVTGQNTSVEAVIGLKAVFNNSVIWLALIFGLLTTFTSFIAIGLNLKKVFWYDLGLKKHLAWALACFTPLILFILGFKDFIAIISLVGGVAMAIIAILIILIYLKAKVKSELEPAYSINLPKFFVYSLILLFILGIIYEAIYFIT